MESRVRPVARALALSIHDRAVVQEPASPYVGIKRAVDVLVALSALVVCTPILLLVAVLIKLDSAGPVIFKQKRVGLNGTVFEILKFRTMVVGAEHLGYRTSEGDERVTRVGGFLRSTKIDELPQLLNVIVGDMSIVGPRPLSVTETDHIHSLGFSANVPGLYPTIKPGLLGLEQANRDRHLTYSDRFALNDEYERTYNWRLDLHILFRCLPQCEILFMTAGAAFVVEAISLLLL